MNSRLAPDPPSVSLLSAHTLGQQLEIVLALSGALVEVLEAWFTSDDRGPARRTTAPPAGA